VAFSALVSAQLAHAADEKPKEAKNEFTVVPFVGGDSDVGLGGGYIASLARVHPEYEPYLYRVESATTTTFKSGGSSGVQVPYIDSYLLLEMPHVIDDQLRIELRVSYTRESTLKYYGLGNASKIPEQREPSDSFFEHKRIHPTFRMRARYFMTERLLFTWGAAYTQNWLVVPENTLLASDMRAGTDHVRDLLGSDENHGVAEFSYGIGWDTRNDEVSPNRGQYHTARIDFAPGGYDGVPYRWARIDLAARVYATIVPQRVTFALRVLSDLLVGDPPFYELPRYDDTSAVGGVKGVRGVPAQRYYGKAKVLSNAELRTELFDFRLLGKNNTFGITAFFDSGRVWADYERDEQLDGTGLGLKYGAGGGVRVQAGGSFVLRIDAAWSPDAHPLAGYISSGHVF
jgi:outer membrane protein assembly factor BamA